VTHLYTILTGGLVLPARDETPVTAIAWAGDTVIGLGSDGEMLGLSRGDSRFVDLGGACVVPLGDGDVAWPVDATIEVGSRADLAVLERDPRDGDAGTFARLSALALVRGGRVVDGRLPGETGGGHDEHDLEPFRLGESPVRPG
jgi:predicted amidohydrolase YtcJ